jgi:hypothetical protein
MEREAGMVMGMYYYYYLFFIYLFIILTANAFLPGGSGYTIRHNKQITHHTK